ncbi:MAG: FtsQ-type POTRA domain-containing protein [Clostridiales bacterium]|nr:FtsQ-type POTRA domain-containing protein [Clostridiales bacterium]
MPDNEKNRNVDEEMENDISEEEQEVSSGSAVSDVVRKVPLKAWLLLVLVLLLLIIGLYLGLNKNFRVQQIHVSGNKRFSTEQILEVSGISIDDHLLEHVGGSLTEKLKLKYGGVRQTIIDSDPYIADAEVYPKYPGEVYIEITERKKVAYVAIPDGYAIISEDSVVLEIISGDVPTGIPEIRGLPIRSAQIGKTLDLTSSEGYDICITILGAILGAEATNDAEHDTFDFLSHVICIRYCDNMTTFVDLDIPGVVHTISVKIGSLQTISDDMNWLRYAIISGYFENKTGSVLDMTGKEYILR